MSEQDERAAMIEAARKEGIERWKAYQSDCGEARAGDGYNNGFTAGVNAALAQTAELREQLRVAREAMRELPNLVPTNWCDPLLTGPDAVFTDEPNCRDIEALLRGIQDRQREALARLDASKKETTG